MNFKLPATTAANISGLSFNIQNTASVTAPKPTFSFGNVGGGDADNVKLSTFGFSQSTALPSTAPTLTAAPALRQATQPILSGFSSFSTATSVASSSAAPKTVGLSFLTQAKTTVGSIIGLGSSTTTLSTAISTTGDLSGATKTTHSASVGHLNSLNYNQLEEYINKCTLDFKEYETTFTEQATKINAWDKILTGNKEKILELNDAVQKVKADQQLLEEELEFIGTQHKELEETIKPLKKEFAEMPQVDVERSNTYLLAENLDTQLKQMSADLVETINNINEANNGQDNTNPIIQIGKILNAHMCSLHWVEDSLTNMCNKLDDIGKMYESQKRQAYEFLHFK